MDHGDRTSLQVAPTGAAKKYYRTFPTKTTGECLVSKRLLLCLLLGLSVTAVMQKLRQQRIATHAYQQRYFRPSTTVDFEKAS